MENNIVIEQMTSKDIDGVFEVEKNCFEHHWSKDAFRKELNNDVARYLVAKLDGKVVGYVGIWALGIHLTSGDSLTASTTYILQIIGMLSAVSVRKRWEMT